MQFIDLKRQYMEYREDIDAQMREVIDSAGFILGPKVAELENALKEFAGTRFAVGVSSGTDALLFCLMALDIGPGDEVVTPPFTFIATAEVIRMLGARPVFADIDPVTYNIDPGRVEAVVTDKTRAVIGVSLYGQCADFASLNALAGPRGIAVIEDGCQSFGAESPGGRSCGLCLAGTTSFFPSKPLGGFGDGGMVFTDDADFADRVNKIHVHGQDRRYHHVMLGANGRLDALQAAVLLGKWPRFPGELDSRRAAGEYYTRGLEPLDRVAVPRELPGHRHVYAQYSIQVDDRDGLAAHLKSRGIPSAVHYPVPLHFQPVFKDLGYREGDFPVSEEASRRIISLPMHPFITREEQDRVIDAVKEFVNP